MAIKRLINWFKSKPRELDGVEYWKEVGGHKLYFYSNVGKMPTFRYFNIRLALEKMGLGIRPSDSKAFINVVREEIVSYVKYQDGEENEIPRTAHLQKIFTLMDHYEYLLESFASERIAIEVGGLGILVDDEPSDFYSEKHFKIKEKILTEHSEAHAFFLSRMIDYFNQLNLEKRKLAEADFLNPQVQERERTFMRLIQLPFYRELWIDLMKRLSGSQSEADAISQRS